MNGPLSGHASSIKQTKLLVVGSGGIGCELLKNLVLSGFTNIETIDLDTIDVSNLNRQFLFQKKHVGMSKALVAKEACEALVSNCNITAHHGSVFENRFNKTYFAQFDLVLNALDNLAARRHVNRLCIASNTTLIESGTAGYLGQVHPIVRGEVECYDCQPKPTRKTYPACTIRNTPTEPVHCIVWAKYLYNQLFGEEDADQDVSPENQEDEDKENRAETEEKVKISTRQWVEENNYDPKLVFEKLFKTDVEYLLSMENLWKNRRKPQVLEHVEKDSSTLGLREVPSLNKLVHIFEDSVQKIKKQKESSEQPLVWDKDDAEALAFVVACANLRAMVFNIPLKSTWDVKSIAGNIIPAIASTNAMVAGLIVLKAINILLRKSKAYRETNVTNVGPRRVIPNIPDKPNKDCYVCRDKKEITFEVDFGNLSVKEFKELLIQKELAFQQPDAQIGSVILIDAEDDELDEKFLAKKLKEFDCILDFYEKKIENFEIFHIFF